MNLADSVYTVFNTNEKLKVHAINLRPGLYVEFSSSKMQFKQ